MRKLKWTQMKRLLILLLILPALQCRAQDLDLSGDLGAPVEYVPFVEAGDPTFEHLVAVLNKPLAEPHGDHLSIDGPTEANVGESVRLEIHGLALDLNKTVAEILAETAKVPLSYSSRDGGELSARSSLALDPLNQSLRYEITLTADKAGVYVVTVRDGETLLYHWLTVGGGPRPPPVDPNVPVEPVDPPVKTVTAVHYFYEKDDGTPPSAVGAGIGQLNSQGIPANIVEGGTNDGTDDIPLQYKVTLPAAKAAGLPALVVLYSDGTTKVVKNPTTAEQVKEAVK